MYIKKIAVVLTAFLFISLMPHVIADEEIELEILGGFGYEGRVYNPGIENLTAHLTAKLLLRNVTVGECGWGCVPYAWSGIRQYVFGISLIKVTLEAGNETLTRDGIVFGIFVIFFT